MLKTHTITDIKDLQVGDIFRDEELEQELEVTNTDDSDELLPIKLSYDEGDFFWATPMVLKALIEKYPVIREEN